MRLLYVVPYTPSPIRVRPWELARSLAAAGHDLTIATLYGGATDRAWLRSLEDQGIGVLARPLGRSRALSNCLRASWSGRPIQAEICWLPVLWRDIRQWIAARPPDALWVEHLRGARYGEALLEERARVGGKWPVVWDSVDCITLLFSQARRLARSPRGRLMAAVDLARTRDYEGRWPARFDRVVVAAPGDRDALVELAGGAMPASHVAVVPNGVDLERFRTSPHPRPPGRLLFTGKLSYHANDAAARFLLESIMPRIWSEDPAAVLTLAGAEAGRQLRRAASSQGARVRLTGWVEDLAPEFGAATLALAPLLYGVGVQNKVLEAMATATPVVATPVAAGALDAVPGVEILIAEGADEFARQALELLRNPHQAAAVGYAGHDYVARHHRWHDSARACAGVLDQAREAAATLASRRKAGA
jgi:glycosyltransferase involved in cell wall biosynthesis